MSIAMEKRVGALKLGPKPVLVLEEETFRLTEAKGIADRCTADSGLAPEGALAQLLAETSDAEAVLYRVSVARPDAVSPMEYGGKFLEFDRALLESITVPAVVLASGPDAYLEILAALPCTVLAWRQADTRVAPESLDALCLTCTDAQGADLSLEVAK